MWGAKLKLIKLRRDKGSCICLRIKEWARMNGSDMVLIDAEKMNKFGTSVRTSDLTTDTVCGG